MSFSPKIKEEALLRSRRSCCVCNKFAGRNTNVHHIIQEADGGPNTIDNAIVLCLDCHGDVGHYNPRHPIGNRYSLDELRRHRDLWWEHCAKSPNLALPRDPISISPTAFRLVAGEWRVDTTLKIYNSSETPIYKIWIKFSVPVEDIDVNKIELRLRDRPIENNHQVGDLEVSNDLISLYGKDDAGINGFLLHIFGLNPKEQIRLRIVYNSRDIIPSRPDNDVIVSLLDFSFDPPEQLVQDNTVAMNFSPPENWSASSIAFLAKKSAKDGQKHPTVDN